MDDMQAETHEFSAEVGRLLALVVHAPVRGADRARLGAAA